MIIHLATSRTGITKDIETLRQIIAIIHRLGHVVASDWIEPQYHVAVSKAAQETASEYVYKQNMDAIDRADLMIVEGSEKSFSCGMQISSALHRKKPTLLLIEQSREKNISAMAKGIKDPLFERKTYNTSSLNGIVTEFIKENTVSTKDLRFNFVIDRQLYNHIRWKSFRARKTKAEIVRELLLRDMEKEG